ncbi:hypothetical protein CRE_04191 [Caenorhabditis remanei]|uniref:F-box domain-containing protein n=1 Tax=Caenorhabditis remanei TaxID=31234 RepID=E3MYX8_CAERE|nr:hypothetical protein CRE_04191 [Caenorhabditis remanei]
MSKVSKPLPLFRLPTLLLTKIIRYMNLKEIFMVSLASKKSAYIIGSLLPPNLFNLEIDFSVESKATVGAEKHWIDPLVIKRMGVYGRPVAKQFCDVCSQWAEGDSVKSLLTHLANVFNPTISIDFGKICHQEFVMEVMNLVKQLNLVKKSIYVSCAALSPENYKYILDECKTIFQLSLFCEISSDFEYRAGPDFRMVYLYVSDGHWVHLEDFTNCNRAIVHNHHHHQQPKYANPEVLRAFIRKWIESECRLQHLEVYGGFILFPFREVLSGLEYRSVLVPSLQYS